MTGNGMIPLRLERASEISLQEQIYREVRGAILAGTLRAGAGLPSSRDLAQFLGVSRNTAVLAYNRLEEEGYIFKRQGAGTFVSEAVPEASASAPAPQDRVAVAEASGGDREPRERRVRHPSVLLRPGRLRMAQSGPSTLQVDFWYGGTNWRHFPLREWRQILTENLSRTSANVSHYGPPEGILELREAIAAHISVTRAASVSADQVIVTAGAQEGLNLISRLFVQPSIRIAVEDPCYLGAALVFRSYGASLFAIPVDQHGMQTALLQGSGATLIYVTPSHQFPTGVTMTRARRTELLDWAEQNGAYIIEDDYDSDFRYDGPPLPSLAGLRNNTSVIYLGTFSKSIGSGLRTGYLIVPKHLVDAARRAKGLANYGHPWVEQIFLSEFLRGGGFARHVRRNRQQYAQSRAALLEALAERFGDVQISGAEAGMHIMWQMPEHFPLAEDVCRIAAGEGVGVYTLSAAGAYETLCAHPRSLILGYATLTPEGVRSGIAKLKSALVHEIPGIDGRRPTQRISRPSDASL
ncbi:PLP-dependent aminotransferase family protein [Xanthobacter sp. KR7-225]|uniref:MocR-like pyridoxine biosynthesis transcription factor PdxR n=1 Tax=Xanthobacter sp. KR7-225 TaxID=3156613 RepID=UPI0032B48728